MTEPTKKVRVMFVDDDPVDQTIYQRMCRRFSDVVSAEYQSYAEDALAAFATQPDPPDVLFLDMRMPRMSGVEFLEKLAELHPAAADSVTVIIATTSLHPDDKEAAMSFSFVRHFTTKPISDDEFESIIKSVTGT